MEPLFGGPRHQVLGLVPGSGIPCPRRWLTVSELPGQGPGVSWPGLTVLVALGMSPLAQNPGVASVAVPFAPQFRALLGPGGR